MRASRSRSSASRFRISINSASTVETCSGHAATFPTKTATAFVGKGHFEQSEPFLISASIGFLLLVDEPKEGQVRAHDAEQLLVRPSGRLVELPPTVRVAEDRRGEEQVRADHEQPQHARPTSR